MRVLMHAFHLRLYYSVPAGYRGVVLNQAQLNRDPLPGLADDGNERVEQRQEQPTSNQPQADGDFPGNNDQHDQLQPQYHDEPVKVEVPNVEALNLNDPSIGNTAGLR